MIAGKCVQNDVLPSGRSDTTPWEKRAISGCCVFFVGGGGQTKMSWQSLLTAWCSRLRLRIKGAVKFFHFGLLCMVVLGMHTSRKEIILRSNSP